MTRRWCTALATAILFLLGSAVAFAPRRAGAQLPSLDVRSEADWIMMAQLPDGAIANYIDRKAIWPYLANFAAMGLARATEVTGDPVYAAASWRWLSWYQAHEDADGFVSDYVVRDGLPVSTGFMDSTDAYAGTYLLAVRATYRATGDRTKLASVASGLEGAVRAIEATQTADGLTWAKPAWRVKYLMDQVETYAGLLAADELATALGNTALADRAADDARRMKAGVDALWNPGLGTYDWAVHESGAHVLNEWSYLYSDAMQQAWAVTFGVVDPLRATLLELALNLNQPNWSYPDRTALFSGGVEATVGYWPIAALGFSQVGLPDVGALLSNIRSASLAANRAWPYTTAIAGQLIMLGAYTPSTSMIAALSQDLLTPPPGQVLNPVKRPRVLAEPVPTTSTTQPAAAPNVATTTPAVPDEPTTTTTAAPTTTTTPPTTTTTTRPPLLGLSLSATPAGTSLGANVGSLGLGVSLDSNGVGLTLGPDGQP